MILLMKTMLISPYRLFTKISPLALLKNSRIHNLSAISSGSRVYNCNVDKYTYVGKNTIMCNTNIGKFCSVSYDCIINPGNHPLNMVSTSPVFYSKKNILKQSFGFRNFEEYKNVTIGNDVWIGARVLIKDGITIGNGAIIGACSVVTKDVEPFTIVAGNPARMIRKRFDDATIKKLEVLEWWNWDDAKLKENATFFYHIDDLLKNYDL
jgi:acetyltransferase-like isoleucine patch superfamily enzyme